MHLVIEFAVHHSTVDAGPKDVIFKGHMQLMVLGGELVLVDSQVPQMSTEDKGMDAPTNNMQEVSDVTNTTIGIVGKLDALAADALE